MKHANLTALVIFIAFLVFTMASVMFGTQVYKKHENADSIDREFDNIYREMFTVVQGSRAPTAEDSYRAGTFWVDISSENLHVRFPNPKGWRKIVTVP